MVRNRLNPVGGNIRILLTVSVARANHTCCKESKRKVCVCVCVCVYVCVHVYMYFS